MTRLVLFPSLPGRVFGAVSAVRAALARVGGRIQVDKAAQEEALRTSLADAARRRGRADGPARAVNRQRLDEVERRVERAAELLERIEAVRCEEPTVRHLEPMAEALGFVRPVWDAHGARRREARPGELQIGR